jgi:3-phenylpropionate/trans-cinnamate dioxygenase ferredoxin reductase subunit
MPHATLTALEARLDTPSAKGLAHAVSATIRDGLLVAGASIERGEDLSVARELMDLEIPVTAEQLADESVELEDLLEQEEVPV